MPTISGSQLPQPKNWDEFEEMCADLFSEEWGDRNATRYGRQGQRQHGVDVYGRPQGAWAAVQCKGRRRWPPRRLTTKDIDKEVAEALSFRPNLTEFTIATTAPDDAALHEHARLLTEGHATRGLFSVHVVGWGEFLRRFTKHEGLLRKHYGFVGNATILEEVLRTPSRVVEGLEASGPSLRAEVAHALELSGAYAESVNAALDRDLTSRLQQAIRRSLFPETQSVDPFAALAQEVMQAPGLAATPGLRRRILLRASRMASIRGRISEAQTYLDAGAALSGDDRLLPAQARLAQAQGHIDDAVRLLRDERDPDSVSTLFSILSSEKGDEDALRFLAKTHIAVSDLTSGGVLALAQAHIRQGAMDELYASLDAVTEPQIAEAPYLLFLRGIARVASVFPKAYQAAVIGGIPIEVELPLPSLELKDLVARLDGAIADLGRVMPVTQELELRAAARIVRWYETWANLLHPYRHVVALTRLKLDMQAPASAVLFVVLALKFDAHFDPKPLEEWLAHRETLGGLDESEFRAALALCLHRNNPKAIAALMAKHRVICEQSLGKPLALVVEIKALTKSGDAASARLLLEDGRSLLDKSVVAQLEAEIATAEGADPVTEHLRVYEETGSLLALRSLVEVLIRKQDHRALAKYSELLYAMTDDPEDIETAAKAFARDGDHENFVRVMQAHPLLKERDSSLKRALAWRLFDSGNLQEAQEIADELAKDDNTSDLNLEVALAIDSGHWERLGLILNTYLRRRANLDGLTLIRAANLAQASGYGPFQELMEAAVEKGPESAEVLLGAYTVAVEGGLEESKPQSHEWFLRALQLSGADGPVQRFDLKELLTRQVTWRDQSRKINDAIVAGDVPLLLAAPALGTTLVGATVGNFVRNLTSSDARKRTAVPLYSGARAPAPTGDLGRVALDLTAVLTLGWLGVLPQALDLFPRIVLPAGILRELFEGRRQLRQFQKSQLVRAQHIRTLLSAGLKVHPVSNSPPDSLVQTVGIDLASLLAAAELNDGVVVRPAPVLQLGFQGEREADMTAHASRLSDTQSLLHVLHDHGAVDQASEAAAERYFRLQDRGWPWSSRPDPSKPIYLDDVAVSYLQTTNLLEAVLRTFNAVYVGSDLEEEATAIIERDRHSTEILRVVDAIRETIAKANGRGNVIFGSRSANIGDDNERDSSTMHLLADLDGVDGVVFDDRALNKNPFATDRIGHNARTLTSLDVLEELLQRGIITHAERQSLRHRLRAAGAALVPIDSDELYAAVLRGSALESAELRVIRESIALAGLREIPRFPAEIIWYLGLNRAVKEALMRVWRERGSTDRVEALADAILGLQPNAIDWVARWHDGPPPQWVEAVGRITVASLAFPVELDDPAVIQRYHRWLDSRVLKEIRENDQDRYEQIVAQIRDLLLGVLGAAE
jgi:hypothetical protein